MAGATAIINLSALQANYRLLASNTPFAECAAVVKANAYGLGIETVAPALQQAGCKQFFVATLDEAIALRKTVPHAVIGVFYGVMNSEEVNECRVHRLTPALNTQKQIALWQKHGELNPCLVHVDTGMTRLGLSLNEASALDTKKLNITCLMTHLACAGESAHPLNALQQKRFSTIARHFPGIKTSFANSSGIFLGQEYHGDLVRPGIALYGSNPTECPENPMQTVLTLKAPVLQIRTLTQSETIGYHATFTAPKGARLATLGIGYADGLPRTLTHKGDVWIAGYPAPMRGIISMDLTVVDISALPEGTVQEGDWAELIGANMPIDAVAKKAGTIAYEILTRLGGRVKKNYKV